MKEIYYPDEDSYLLSEVLRKRIPSLLSKNKNLKFLEIGCGSGIQLLTLKSLGAENIFGVDINEKAVEHCKKLGFNSVVSDLFQAFERKVTRRFVAMRMPIACPRFDIIVFNPPYLPFDSREPKNSRIATTGGKEGSEIINEFLKQSKEHLAKNSKIFLVSSSLTKGINFRRFKKKTVGKKKIFFEELRVWELS